MKKVMIATMVAAATATVLSANGADIFKKCAACHGPTGKTVYAGKVPALAGQDVAAVTEKLKGYVAGTANHYGMGPVMQAQAKMNLKSDADIAAVAEFIAGLK